MESLLKKFKALIGTYDEEHFDEEEYEEYEEEYERGFSLGLITLWIVFEISIVSVKEFFLVVEPLISHSIYVNY